LLFDGTAFAQLASFNGQVGVMLDVMKFELQIDSSSANPRANRDKATASEGASGQASTPLGKPTAPEISLSDLHRQVKRDLLAKEVQTSPTYSYQWMAAQAGHIALGLLIVLWVWWTGQIFDPGQSSWIPVVGAEIGRWFAEAGQWIDSIAGKNGIPPVKLPWIGFCVAAIFISALEVYDYVKASRKLERLFNAARDRKDLRDNVGAAIYYVLLGAGIALAALLSWTPWLGLLIPILIVAPAFYWLRQKMRFQQIGLPFLFRLPEFKLDGFPPGVAKMIDDFIRTSGDLSPKHIAIVGELGTGKTNLAVGIATEGAFNGKKGRYLTLSKLRQIAPMSKEPDPPRNLVFWPWREAQILVIDDVVSADSPEQLKKVLQVELGRVLESMRLRYTVWCLGANTTDSDRWIDALRSDFVKDESDLLIVILEKSREQDDRVVGKFRRGADSGVKPPFRDDAAHPFRDDLAHRSEMMSPTIPG